MSITPAELPEGWLLTWYGDDFTGSAAVMDVLSFSGVPSVLFLGIPTPELLAEFAGYRACGIASTARAQAPDWMEINLPPAFQVLSDLDAPLLHFKVCSTFDSSPAVGSIGKAIDLAAPIIRSDWIPLLIGAPEIGRYQVFGNLFAVANHVGYRLDRHPTMSRHPATPMDEADVRVHLAKQTTRAIGLVDMIDLERGRAGDALAREREAGMEIIALDVVDKQTLSECGRLIWDNRNGTRFAVGSQGVEYALIAYWRDRGWIDQPSAPSRIGRAKRVVAVSGSCSHETAGQIRRAAEDGFEPIVIDACRALDPDDWTGEIDRSVAEALKALGDGRDPILYTALGPDDPAVTAYNEAVAGRHKQAINERVGSGLGQILKGVIKTAGPARVIVAGGDTSGHAAQALGIHALTAIAPISPAASVSRAHAEDRAIADLEIALKGGQMGTLDYFIKVREGHSAVG
jgi:uncharacterized protein YgbK (DUF1537 family)